MLRWLGTTLVLLASIALPAAAQSQLPTQPKQQTMDEAIRFERHKIAAAKAQAAKEAAATQEPQAGKQLRKDAGKPRSNPAKPRAQREQTERREYSRK